MSITYDYKFDDRSEQTLNYITKAMTDYLISI